MALQALATMAALTSSHDLDLTVRVNTDDSAAVAVFHMDQDNFLVQQSRQVRSSANLPDPRRSSKISFISFQIEAGEGLHLQVTAEGRGLALFQVGLSGKRRLLVANSHTTVSIIPMATRLGHSSV